MIGLPLKRTADDTLRILMCGLKLDLLLLLLDLFSSTHRNFATSSQKQMKVECELPWLADLVLIRLG